MGHRITQPTQYMSSLNRSLRRIPGHYRLPLVELAKPTTQSHSCDTVQSVHGTTVRLYRQWLCEERQAEASTVSLNQDGSQGADMREAESRAARALSQCTRVWAERLQEQRDEAQNLEASLRDSRRRASLLEAEKAELQGKVDALQCHMRRNQTIALSQLGQPLQRRQHVEPQAQLRRAQSFHLWAIYSVTGLSLDI